MNAEHCYRSGCDQWVTGASDYCSEACETEARKFSVGRIGEHAVQAADTMDRLREESRAALAAYQNYQRKIMQGMST